MSIPIQMNLRAVTAHYILLFCYFNVFILHKFKKSMPRFYCSASWIKKIGYHWLTFIFRKVLF